MEFRVNTGRLAGSALLALGHADGNVETAASIVRRSGAIDSADIVDHLIRKAAVPAVGVGEISTAYLNDPVDLDFLATGREVSLLERIGGNPAGPRTRLFVGTAIAAARVPEGAAMRVVLSDIVQDFLEPIQHGAITVATRELLQLSPAALAEWLTKKLAVAVFEAENISMLDPAYNLSLLNGVTPITSTGVTASAFETDIGNLLAAFRNSGSDLRNLIFVTTPTVLAAMAFMCSSGSRTFGDVGLNGGTLLGAPVLSSIAADVGSTSILVALDRTKVFTWRGPVELDQTTEASLQMDSAPTMHAVTPVATTAVSLFVSNSVGFRVVISGAWGAGPNAVQFIDAIAL